MMRILRIVPVVAAIALFTAAPALAQDHVFKVFVTADWISPLGEEDVSFGSIQDSVQASDEVGYEAGFEWRLNKIVGLEGSYMVADMDIEFGDDSIGSLDQTAVTAALNFHIIPNKVFDLWVAPVASWVDWSDFTLDSSLGGGTIEVDSDVVFGAAVGFDIGIGKTFAITAGLRWLSMDVEGDNFEPLPVDPLIARAGIAFRFGTR